MINEMTAVLADSMFSIVVHLSHHHPPRPHLASLYYVNKLYKEA